MKILKRILVAIVSIVVLLLIVALFVPKEFKTEKEITINKPKQEVFDYIKLVKNQDNFGVWQLSDPDLKSTEEGIDGTVGYKNSWDGKKTGKGSQTITNIVEGERVDSELDFGMGDPAKAYFITNEVSPTETNVVWGIEGKSPYPMNLMGLFFDMGDDFEQGLKNLKELVEAQESPETEKDFALDYYQNTFNNLKESVAGLSEEQLQFKPTEESWSISQCLEHIIVTESMIFGMIKEYMTQPENPERRPDIKMTDEELLATIIDRSEKYKAPEALQKEGIYTDSETAINDLANQRKDILDFINNTPIESLRNRINDMPGGAADVYQSVLFIAGHTARHTLQIDEVKSSPNFPKQ